MVAIFTGQGAGFERGSGASLGGVGLLGSSGLGRNGAQTFVNAANGNFLITRQDEFLVGLGPDSAISRTYNSQGALDENGDDWRQSTDRRVFGLTGNIDEAGSSVKRVSADGSEITYSWNGSVYETTDGAGAYDHLSYGYSEDEEAYVWTWTDGDTQVREAYEAHGTNNWRIVSKKDTDGNALSFAYLGDQLDTVTTENGDYTKYSWSGNNITQISTHYTDFETSTVKTLTRTLYTYDGANRLKTVMVDLSPENNSLEDSNVYTTTYTYHGSSNRVATISQTDGSSLAITYDGSNRVQTLTQTVTSGESRVTGFAYYAGRTEITDPLGNTTKLYYDNQNQLIEIESPPAVTGAAAQSVQFTYDALGNVTSVTDAAGAVTEYRYDANGNVSYVRHPNGSTTLRTYDDENHVTQEITTGASITLPATVANQVPVAAPVSTSDITSALAYANASNNRFVYNYKDRLRYQVSGEGHVTEYRYKTTGELQYAITYPEHTYTSGTSVPTNNEMNSWRDGLTDRSTTQIVKNYYDARGTVYKSQTFGIATAAGVNNTSEGYTEQHYTYDQAGQLLSRHTTSQETETFVYDGMGRLTGSTDLDGGTTNIVFNDAATTTVVTTDLGHVTTSVYNKAGELISQTDSGSDADSAGETNYEYDANGQVRQASVRYGRTNDQERTDNSYSLYNDIGQKVADIGHDGELVEYRYDANGRVVATIRYKNTLSTTLMSSLEADPAFEVDLPSVRPAAHGYDIWEWTAYDTTGRVIQTVDGDGSVTSYEYDFADRLIGTYNYYNKLSVSSYMNATSTGPGAALPSAHAKDTVSRTFYDRDGRVIGALNAEGYLSQIVYDGAGQKTSETVFADATAANLRASGTYSQLLGSVTQNTSEDITTRYIYDGQGLLRFTIDALGQVNENVYFEGTMSNAIGLVRRTIQHAASLGTLNDYSYASVKAAVAALGNTADNRSDRMVYNSRGQLDYQIDPEGSVTRYFYDSQGNTIRTVVYAAQYSDTSLPSVSTMDSWASANGSGRRITRYIYSTGGHLLAEIDAEGYVTRNYYDAQGRLWNSERFSNRVSANASWTINDVDAADKGTAALTRYRYDRMGRLNNVYDPNGTRTWTGYRANGTKSWEMLANGQGDDEARTLFHYDQSGRLIKRHDYISDYETGTRTSTYYAYDGLGNLLSVTDPRGNETSYTYDKLGRVLTQEDAEGGTIHYKYDAFGNVVKVTDARDNDTYNYYDQAGRLTDSVDAENYLTRTSYTAFGEVEAVTRFYNKVSGTPTVNNHNEPATHALDATTQFEYDKLSRLTKTIDAEGAFERNWYDAFGLRYQSRNKLGGITTYEYDKLGRMVKETLPVAAYDMDGSIEAANIVNKYVYDSRGNRTQAIEAFGLSEQRTTTYAYDAAGRVTSITGDSVQTVSSATGAVTSSAPTETFVYDRRGNVIEHTDASGQRTLSWYDRLDRLTDQLTQKSATKGALVQHTYDANGNITETRAYETLVTLPANATGTAPAGTGVSRVTTFTYDKLNRLETSTVPSIQTGVLNGTSYTVTTGSLTTSYKYDANGNVVKITDPNGGKTFTYYDKLGRKTEQVDQENYLTRWTYDSEGNVTQERRFAQKLDATPTIESRGTVNFNYPAGALSTALGQTYQDRVTDFTYDRMGRRETELRQNVIVSNGGGGYAVQDSVITYTYNGLGQVLTKTEAVDAGGAATNTYVYDGAGRLKKETRKSYTDFNDNSVTPTVDYYYDGLGNMVRNRARGATGAAQRVTQFEYVAGGQLKRSIDATGFSRYFYYDTAGRVRREEYDRETPTGTVLHEAVGTDYDEAGRVIAQGALKQSGSVWTRGGNDTDIDTAVMKYNAFDEITERGINNKYAEKFEYDKAGRLIRTNSGDGVWKHFLYDKNGNQTLAVTSDGTNLNGASYNTIGEIITAFGGASGLGTAYVDGIVTTITAYDNRGLATSVREPQRQLSATGTRQTLVTRRSYNAFGEVIAETDAKNKTIDYAYNTMGRRIRTESPTVSITNEDGSTQNVRPTEKYYYDVSGRLVASRDANNNLTRLELLAGTGFGGTEALVTKTTTADSAFTEVKYDIHGDARTMIDQLGRSTTQAYDKMGRVTQVHHAGGLIDYYKYDGLGQQIKHHNNFFGTNMAETTLYDRQGRIQQQIAMGGDATSYTYVWSGSLATGALGTFGGWTETTTYANGRTLTEETDLFGRALSKNDLGSHVYNYTYDAAGRLTTSSATGATTSYSYLNTGKMSAITQGSLVTTYGYDKTSNLTSEILKSGTTLYSSQSSTYDALGRISAWTEAGGTKAPAASMTFTYDANGNIRNTVGTFHTLDSSGAVSSGTSAQDYWYRYDKLNRVVTQKGRLLGGQIYRDNLGTDIFYDDAGQRTYTLSTIMNTAMEYTGGGLQPINPEIPPDGGGEWVMHTDIKIHREDYDYDTAGRLSQVNSGDTVYSYTYAIGEILPLTSAQKNALTADEGVKRADFEYDPMGRQTRQRDYTENGTTIDFEKFTSYFSSTTGNLRKDKIEYEDTIVRRGTDTYASRSWYSYAQSVYSDPFNISQYALGAVTNTLTQNFKKNIYHSPSGLLPGDLENGTSTISNYVWYDGASQGSIIYYEQVNAAGGGAGGVQARLTQHSYDAFGQMTSANISDGRSRVVTYTNNAAGQIIRRDEADGNSSTGDPHEVWYRYGGKEMGYVGNNGTTNTNYATSITSRTATASTTAFRNGAAGSSYVDFDQSLNAINSYNKGSAAGSYTVRAGDTLSSIAANVWGDSSLWYKLAEANGMTGQNSLIEGASLRLPAGVMKNTHNASTFQPYDPAEAIGDTAPTTPKPPKKNKCGVFGQVLLVVVAVVVAVATKNLALGAKIFEAGSTAAAITTGATAGAAGSIASQAVGVATGIQSKFSWTAVASSALAGGLGANTGSEANAWKAAGDAIQNNAISQVASIALGPQKKFDWAGAAAAGASGGIGALTRGPAEAFFGAGKVATGLTTATVATSSSVAYAATKSAIDGSSFGDNFRASIPSIIGQSIASAITAAPKRQAEANPTQGGEVGEKLDTRIAAGIDRLAQTGRVGPAKGSASLEVPAPDLNAPEVSPLRKIKQSKYTNNGNETRYLDPVVVTLSKQEQSYFNYLIGTPYAATSDSQTVADHWRRLEREQAQQVNGAIWLSQKNARILKATPLTQMFGGPVQNGTGGFYHHEVGRVGFMTASAILDTGASMTPVLGEASDVSRFVGKPNPLNAGTLVIDAIPVAGDALSLGARGLVSKASGAGDYLAVRKLQGLSSDAAKLRYVDPAGVVHNLDYVSDALSSQRQLRHVAGSKQYKGGGYFDSIADAEAVFSAFRRGEVNVLAVRDIGGRNPRVIFRYEGVTGFNNNPGAGYMNQPTNIFELKGSKSPSIVPKDPTWK